MPPPARGSGRLLTCLASAIGKDAAARELRWMQQALARGLPDHVPKMNLDAMVVRRARGEPLQYILGTQPFGSLDILTRPPVLIPRPETEFWTIKLSEILVPPAGRRVSLLDLCTGSGCIPLLLCRLWPSGSVRAVGLDISHEAVQLASDNALAAGIPAASDAANSGENTFTPVLGDIFASATWTSPLLQAPFDVITSNPPYISREDYGKLSLSVKDYEDPRALLGDLPDSEEQRGLSFYHRIAQLISDKRLLKPGGLLAFEVGEKQAGDVRRIVQDKAGIRDAEIWRDPWGKERVVIGRS